MSLAGSLYTVFQDASWDDLRAPASSIPIRGQSGDPDSDVDGSLLFDGTSAEQVAILYQMPHAWVEGSGVRFHAHWAKTATGAGHVRWEMRYRAWDNNAVTPDWSAWAAATGISLATGTDLKTRISAFPEIAMAGIKGSGLLSIQLRRNSATGADTYNGTDARLWDADVHYRVYGLGSEQEYPT
jgi:hypothetical protein